jgi:hypothetical protein
MSSLRNPLILGGVLLILLGIAGLTVPAFGTHHLTDVARIGDLKVQADEYTSHVVPRALSIAVLVAGVVLAAIGFAPSRR